MSKPMINTTRLDEFFQVYARELDVSREKNPLDYLPNVDNPTIVARMRASVEKSGGFGSVNKDSPTFRRTCKALGIKHTYKAMDEYIHVKQ